MRAALDAEGRALLDAAAHAADALGMELWIVGGALRDLAAGLPVHDLDAAVCGDAAALAAQTSEAVGGSAEVAPRFGTAAVHLGGRRLDLATTRSEHYPRPGALPRVILGATIEADLTRRDFTVNALALCAAGPRRDELLDPVGGIDDLAARRLRALYPRTFIDDATRLWRGARVAAALRLRPVPETAAWLAEGPRWLAPISGRRLWAEIERTARQRAVLRTLRLLDGWGVLQGTAQGWRLDASSIDALRHRPGPHPVELLLAVLLAPLGRRGAVLERLGATHAARAAVEDAVLLLAAPDTSAEVLTALERTGEASRTAARWLEPGRQAELQRALRRWQHTRSPLNATALRRLGVASGPALGAWLRRLRRERYLGTLRDAAAARTLVRHALAAGEAP